MTKKVYFEPSGSIHSVWNNLIHFPPNGYKFVLSQSQLWDYATYPVLNSKFVTFTLHRKLISKVLPVPLVKAWIEGYVRRPPEGCSFTFAVNHIVFRDEPWLTFIEWPHMLAGFNIQHFYRHKLLLEKKLSSNQCKWILTWSEVALDAIRRNLNSKKFEQKLLKVHLAVAPKNFTKQNHEAVTFLFLGSPHSQDDFHYRGGKETLVAFEALNRRFSDLQLIMRANVPYSFKSRYSKLKNVKIFNKVLPWNELEQLFKISDIFLFPGHDTPWGAILDAMSYELPVIATDVYANRELIKDGISGFLIKRSRKVPYFWANLIPSGATPLANERRRAIVELIDYDVVADLIEKASILIFDQGLRRRMGKAARLKVEEGENSIKKRNLKLKAIFDEIV